MSPISQILSKYANLFYLYSYFNETVFRYAFINGYTKFSQPISQIEVHPYLKQSKMVDFCTKNGITVTAHSCIGSRDRPWYAKALGEYNPLTQIIHS